MIRIASLPAMLAALVFAGPAIAAEQGAFGASSKGEIVITVTVASRATMSDIAASGDPSGGTHAACVWMGTATHGYALSVLNGGVRWRAAGLSQAGAAILPGQTLTGLVAPATLPDCDHDAAHLEGYAATSADPATPATLLIAPE